MSFEQELKYHYYLGYEHASENFKLIDWFQKESHKIAYMQGRMDFEIGEESQSNGFKEWSEILEDLNKRIK